MERERFKKMMKAQGHWRDGAMISAESVSQFREDDRGSVTKNEKLSGYWVDGLPDETKKTARPLIKEGKYLAIEQLTVARKFLCNPSNHDIASVISHLFFGVNDMEYMYEKWLRGIKKVLDGLNGLDTKKHVEYLPSKKTSAGIKLTTAAEIDVNAYADRKGKYMNVYAESLIKINETPSLGRDHLAHVVIHEMSHACLGMNDHAYIGVMSNDGFHDLTEMIGLLIPKPLPLSKYSHGESNKQHLARGREMAWNNADSFTTSVRYLAYVAKKPDFFNHVSQQKESFKHDGRLLIKSPHWKNV